jgi:hypothetical protein
MFVGCATIPQGSSPSSSPLISGNGHSRSYKILGNAEGSAGHFSLFGIIPFGRTNIDKAIKEAIDEYNGDNLINVTYNVNSTYYIVGFSTSLTVKGDVIKYVENNISNKDMSSDDKSDNISANVSENTKTISHEPVKKGINPYHRFTLGSAVDGFSADYSYIQPINPIIYWSANIGFKGYSNTSSYQFYNYYNGGYFRYSYDYSYTAIPITFNIGVYGKDIINIPNIPVNPYASIGFAYIPIFGSNVSDQYDQIGINFNIGAEYMLMKDLAVGIEYRYLKSVIELPINDNSGIGFSNLNVSLSFRP